MYLIVKVSVHMLFRYLVRPYSCHPFFFHHAGAQSDVIVISSAPTEDPITDMRMSANVSEAASARAESVAGSENRSVLPPNPRDAASVRENIRIVKEEMDKMLSLFAVLQQPFAELIDWYHLAYQS